MSNLSDDWGAYYYTCHICGSETHASGAVGCGCGTCLRCDLATHHQELNEDTGLCDRCAEGGIWVDYGSGETEHGPGVLVRLDGAELAKAVDHWLHGQGFVVSGRRTVRFDGELARDEARRESTRHRRVDASVFVPELPYRDPDLEAQRARVRAARLAREREQASQAGTAPAGPCPHSASESAQGAIRPPADLGYQGQGDRRSEAARGGRADGPSGGGTVKREGGLT